MLALSFKSLWVPFLKLKGGDKQKSVRLKHKHKKEVQR
jgi:hypothetical protein